MKFSILTATYNRAKYLPRLYKSMVDNMDDSYEIEWLIMDDGSTDNTEEVCKNFVNKKNLVVKYYKQENQGKMQAINNLGQYVSGELWIECDSDDYFVKNAFQIIKQHYEKNKEQQDIYAFAFLKYNQNKKNMGQNFKKEKTTMFDLYFKEGENGEKALAFVADIRRKYHHELEHGEKFVTEARMYHKMDKDYKILCINEPIMICEYQESGYSKNINNEFINNPFGYYQYFYEILNNMDTKNIVFKKRLYVIKNYILFSYLTNQKCRINVRGVKDKILIVLLYIPGYIKSYLYKKKLRRTK